MVMGEGEGVEESKVRGGGEGEREAALSLIMYV